MVKRHTPESYSSELKCDKRQIQVKATQIEKEGWASEVSEVCLVNANIQLPGKTWPRLWKLCVSVSKWEQERPMFLLTSGVQISSQKKLCVCVLEVKGHSCGRRKYKHGILKKWPLQSHIMWKSHHSSPFPVSFNLNWKTRHDIFKARIFKTSFQNLNTTSS